MPTGDFTFFKSLPLEAYCAVPMLLDRVTRCFLSYFLTTEQRARIKPQGWYLHWVSMFTLSSVQTVVAEIT